MPSAHDADIVRRDANLPGLAVLLDSDAFVDVLSREFPFLAPTAAELQYVRYKPGTSCLGLYRVIGVDGPCHVYAKAFTPARGEKLRHWRSNRMQSTGRTRCATDTWHLGISLFPDDRRLKTLKRLLDPSKRQAIISSAFGTSAHDERRRLATLRYKPERRYVAALTNDRGPTAVLKMYDSVGYRVARARARLFTSRQALLVPGCIGECDKYRLLGFEWVSGRELHEALSQDANSQGVELAGAALAEVHGHHASGLAISAASAAVRAAAESVAAVAPRLAARIRSLAASIASRLQEAVGCECPAHGDFNADQVIITGARAAILDFDRACLAHPASDLGTFAAHLQYAVLRGAHSEEAAEACLQRLLQGYRGTRSAPAPRDVATHTAAALVRLAPEPFRRHQQGWHQLTEAVLDRAAHALEAQTERSRSRPDGGGGAAGWSFLRPALNPLDARARLEDALSRLDATHATLRHIRVSRYKPGRRCIVEYAFDTGPEADGEPLVILGKSRMKGLNGNAHFALESLWRAGFTPSHRAVCVPQPLGTVPAWRMTLQRKVKGDPAGGRLESADGVRVAARVAEAIFELHARGPAPVRRHTIDDELQILRVRLQQARGHAGVGRIERLLEKCEQLASALPPCRPQPIHRDFYPDHVLVDGDRLWLIDLDLYSAGDPALDVGNFIAHMIEARLRRDGSADGLTEPESTLETRYAHLAGRQVLPAIRAYTTLSLARHVQLSTHYPGRFHTTAALLDLCERRLSTGLERQFHA